MRQLSNYKLPQVVSLDMAGRERCAPRGSGRARDRPPTLRRRRRVLSPCSEHLEDVASEDNFDSSRDQAWGASLRAARTISSMMSFNRRVVVQEG
jgi:hypothetical protein